MTTNSSQMANRKGIHRGRAGGKQAGGGSQARAVRYTGSMFPQKRRPPPADQTKYIEHVGRLPSFINMSPVGLEPF